MTNLDSILKSRHTTLITKVHLVKAMVKCGEFQPRDRCREVSRGAKQKSFCGKNLWIITLDPLGEETFLS